MNRTSNLFRRLTSLLLAAALMAALAIPVFAEGAESSDIVYINSITELLALAEKCSVDSWSRGKTVILQQDLTLDQVDWEPIPSFSGTFRGSGHTIRDLELTGSYSPAGLFAIVEEGGLVQDLTVQGYVAPGGEKATLGGIVGVNRGTLLNCQFVGAVSGDSEVGGLVGRNESTGTIARCTSRSFVSGKSKTGGVVGSNEGAISSCTNVGAVNTEYQDTTLNLDGISAELLSTIREYLGQSTTLTNNAATDTGGIAGHSTGMILSCTNSGNVGYAHLGYNVGGIVGRTDGSVSGCINQGKILGRKDVGGIAGQAEPYRAVDLSQSTIDKLRTELDKLHDLVSDTADVMDNSTDRISGDLDGLNGQMNAAIDAARQLKDQGSDYADTVADEIDRTGVLVSDTLSRLEPVLDTGKESVDHMSDALDQMKWASTELSYEISMASDALGKAETAADQTSDAMDTAQKGLKEIADGFEALKNAYDSGDDSAAETAIQGILGTYSTLPAGTADAALDSAVNWLKLANTAVSALSLTRSMSPQMQALSAGVTLLQGAALVTGSTEVQQGFNTVIKALGGISTISKQLGSLAKNASSLAQQEGKTELSDALTQFGDGFDGIGGNTSDLEQIFEDLGFDIDGLTDGGDKIQSGVDKLSKSADKLQDASDSLKSAVSELKTTGYLTSATVEQLSSAIDTMEEGTKSLSDMLSQTSDIVSWLNEQDPIQVPRPSSELKDTTNTLFDAVEGMSAEMDALNQSMKTASSQLTGKMRAINDQVNVVVSLLLDALEEISEPGSKTYLDDESESWQEQSDGRIENCTNRGSIDADVDVGGIAGAMAVENLLDPEDDTLQDSGSLLTTGYTVSAVAVNCINEGAVTAKKKASGGIVGRMDLGLVLNAENYGAVTGGDQVGGIAGAASAKIQSSWAKCDLSGGSYVGGILGQGTESDTTKGSSSVVDCRALVDILEADQYAGAISGGQDGSFSGNLFVSDSLRGIDRLSRAGQAEPVDFATLIDQENTPANFKKLTVTFKDEDHVITKKSVEYGGSLTAADYPDLPTREGCYTQWDKTTLDSLHLDTTVSVVYTPYVQALRSASMREGGRPVFFAEGDFTDTDVLLTVQQEQTDAPHGTVEQWQLTIPTDGAESHTIRLLPPDSKSYHVYALQDGSWKKLDTDTMGSYLTFSITGTDAQVALVKSPLVWPWIAAGAALVLGGGALVIRKKKRKQTKQPAKAEPETETTES